MGEGEGGMIWENSIETCILSSVKQIASPGWMHETSAQGWLGWPRGIGWGGRWEGGPGWGTHVKPWLIHSLQILSPTTSLILSKRPCLLFCRENERLLGRIILNVYIPILTGILSHIFYFLLFHLYKGPLCPTDSSLLTHWLQSSFFPS